MQNLVGFIGLGSMGAHIAARLSGHGVSVIVNDLNASAASALVSKGARVANSPREVSDSAAIVFTCLPTNSSLKAVALGPSGLVGGTKTKIVVNLGTIGAEFSISLGDALSRSGMTLVDAPMGGGVTGAERGTLAVVVSAEKPAFDAVKPYLDMIASNVVYLGAGLGKSQIVKLVNNLLSTVAVYASTESFIFLAKAGIGAAEALEFINVCSGRNSATADKFPRTILTQTYNAGATMDILWKDVNLCLLEARKIGAELPIGDMIGKMFDDAHDAGLGNEDFMSIISRAEKAAGVRLVK